MSAVLINGETCYVLKSLNYEGRWFGNISMEVSSLPRDKNLFFAQLYGRDVTDDHYRFPYADSEKQTLKALYALKGIAEMPEEDKRGTVVVDGVGWKVEEAAEFYANTMSAVGDLERTTSSLFTNIGLDCVDFCKSIGKLGKYGDEGIWPWMKKEKAVYKVLYALKSLYDHRKEWE